MVSSSLKPVPQVLTQSSFFKKKLVAHVVHIVSSVHAWQFDSQARQLYVVDGLLGRYSPAAQDEHALTVAVAAYWPTSHVLHDVDAWALRFWYCPMPQVLQVTRLDTTEASDD